VPLPAGAVGAIAVFGDGALKSHHAGVPKQRRADLAALEVRDVNAGNRTRK
jgi:hypothetical protein